MTGKKIDKIIKPLVLIMHKMSGYVKTFNVKEWDNKSMSFSINDEKLLVKYKATWTKIEDLNNIELNPLLWYLFMITDI